MLCAPPHLSRADCTPGALYSATTGTNANDNLTYRTQRMFCWVVTMVFSSWGSSYYFNILKTKGWWRSHTAHLQSKSKQSQNQKPLRPELSRCNWAFHSNVGTLQPLYTWAPFSPESIFGFYLLTDSIASHLALIPVALIAVIPVFRSARDKAYSKPSGCIWWRSAWQQVTQLYWIKFKN